MPNKRQIILFLAGVGALILLQNHQAGAQTSNGTIRGPSAIPQLAEPIPPRGPQQSRMPLADPEQFRLGQERAPKSVPTGRPGVSTQPGVSGELEPEAFGTST